MEGPTVFPVGLDEGLKGQKKIDSFVDTVIELKSQEFRLDREESHRLEENGKIKGRSC